MKYDIEQCKSCSWPKLAQAYHELLNARARKDGREQIRLHELIHDLKEQIEKENDNERLPEGG